MIQTSEQAIVDNAITSRRSVRAFLPDPVAREDIEQILQVASRAPSGTNTQPWKVHVLIGDAKEALSRKILAVYNDPQAAAQHVAEYHYYPEKWVSPYIDRRRKVGWDLYGLLGLKRDDKAGMHAQHGRNYTFFDAPVGMMFTIDRVMERGSWLDCGMFIENVMIAARGRGLDTCAQAAFTQFHRIVAEQLELAEHEMLICGMALGYADHSKIEDTLVTERAPLNEFVRFYE